MPVTQAEFRAALLDAQHPVPEGLVDASGGPAGRRYAVYRNNVTVSLIEAMKLAFPTVRGLLGPQNFDTLVPMFVRAHPPRSPLMMHYGTDFPDFLSGFEPLAHLGYLADVARLDLAMRASYHAGDAAAFDPAALQQPPEDLAQLRLHRAPATRLLRSPWPVFDLWRRARDPNAPKPRAEAQAVLITRPEFDPAPHLLPPGAATWLIALETTSFGAALETTLAAVPDFNFEATLTLTLSTHAFASPKDIA
ncbi:putative DNA-binding domain-containing protein [Sulfitobacter albidus]|uniref:DNA-binding domain-containing protein n=1 Tax=Sulfitobacter albidus TaxID=2829501 RepID=A0A975JF45_9RHOB|nr:putative DNA-binding domain-containing protein [Sulfitobacter albidus]QUJ77110.1 putative DNA-binding domain-containing protein [Sulfitobacter albidus]